MAVLEVGKVGAATGAAVMAGATVAATAAGTVVVTVAVQVVVLEVGRAEAATEGAVLEDAAVAVMAAVVWVAALMAEADLVVVRLANAHHNHGSLCLLRKCWRSPHRHHPHRFHSMPALLARVLGMARVEAWHHLSNMRGQAACYETRMATAKEMGLPMATVTVMVPVMGRLPGTC